MCRVFGVDRRRFHGVFDFWSWRRYFALRGSIASYPVNIACLCVSSRSITPSHVFAAYQTRRYQFHQLEHKRDKLRGRRFFGGTLAAHMRNRTRINVHLMVCVDALVVSLAHKLLDLSLTMLELEYLTFYRLARSPEPSSSSKVLGIVSQRHGGIDVVPVVGEPQPRA